MREMARVWNLHTEDYTEVFKEKKVVVPARGYIEMDPGEASSFMRTFTPVVRDNQGRDLHPKKLKLELFKMKGVPKAPKPTGFPCMICSNLVLTTQKEYDAHVKANHMGRIVDKKSTEAFIEKSAPAKPAEDDVDVTTIDL